MTPVQKSRAQIDGQLEQARWTVQDYSRRIIDPSNHDSNQVRIARVAKFVIADCDNGFQWTLSSFGGNNS